MKWQPEEILRLYTFVFYNFKYITAVKFAEELKAFIQYDNNSKVVSVDFGAITSINQFYPNSLSGMSTPSKIGSVADSEDFQPIKKTTKKKRAKQLCKTFYEKLEKFFNRKRKFSRIRKLLRCRTNKMFEKNKLTENKYNRWGNNQIIFKDLVEIFLKHPQEFHCSKSVEKAEEPFQEDEIIIRTQIKKYFKIDFEYQEIPLLCNKKFNQIYWREYAEVFYPNYCAFLKEMEKMKEIFKRNFKSRNSENEQQFKDYMKLMADRNRRMEKLLLYLNAEYTLLERQPIAAITLKETSEQKSQEVKLMKQVESTGLKVESEKKNKKKILKKRKKKISRFQAQEPGVGNYRFKMKRKKKKRKVVDMKIRLKIEPREFEEVSDSVREEFIVKVEENSYDFIDKEVGESFKKGNFLDFQNNPFQPKAECFNDVEFEHNSVSEFPLSPIDLEKDEDVFGIEADELYQRY